VITASAPVILLSLLINQNFQLYCFKLNNKNSNNRQ
jgi:hypothetical protein